MAVLPDPFHHHTVLDVRWQAVCMTKAAANTLEEPKPRRSIKGPQLFGTVPNCQYVTLGLLGTASGWHWSRCCVAGRHRSRSGSDCCVGFRLGTSAVQRNFPSRVSPADIIMLSIIKVRTLSAIMLTTLTQQCSLRRASRLYRTAFSIEDERIACSLSICAFPTYRNGDFDRSTSPILAKTIWKKRERQGQRDTHRQTGKGRSKLI